MSEDIHSTELKRPRRRWALIQSFLCFSCSIAVLYRLPRQNLLPFWYVVSHNPTTFGRSICLVERIKAYTPHLRPYRSLKVICPIVDCSLFWGTKRLYAKSWRMEMTFRHANRFLRFQCWRSGLPDQIKSNKWRETELRVSFSSSTICVSSRPGK